MKKIQFSPDRWEQVKEAYGCFWNRKLQRPLAGVAVRENTYDDSIARIPLLSQRTCHDFSYTPEQLADRIIYEVSQYSFYGDAFPMFGMDCFGPGVVAAFLGANLDNSTGGVWFHPTEKKELEELRFEYDPENKWLKRLKSIYKAVYERSEGQLLMGMTDLGGVLDVLSTFRPGEELLLDLYDNPEEVLRLLPELTAIWQRFYDELHAEIPNGFTDWSTMYSDKPSYIIQSDFTYMIGPDMFAEFALPTLRKHCQTLDRTIYHLDGPGELPHLDMLLEIPELDAVQWVPGDGNPPCDHYIELYKRIIAAGKQVKLTWCGFDTMKKVISQIGPKGVFHPMQYFEAGDKDYAISMLGSMGIDD